MTQPVLLQGGSPFAQAAERWHQPDYSKDVVAWAEVKLGVNLWSIQGEIANAVPVNPQTLVRSCHDSGKTFLAAVCGCHHIDVHPMKQARLVSTAPSGDQVRGLLWNEINQLHERAAELGHALPGYVNQTEWWIGSYQAGVGRKPSDYKPANFAGFHARYMMVVADEADGIPAAMWGSIDSLLTSGDSRLLAIGNPDDPQSQFHDMQAQVEAAIEAATRDGADQVEVQRMLGRVFRISAWDTPNFSGEEVSDYVRGALLQKDWVEIRRDRWGTEHPFWASKVEAEYPGEDQRTIVKATWLAAISRPTEDTVPELGTRQIGVDVAGSEAGDLTVVRERVGNVALREWVLHDSSDPQVLHDFIVEKTVETGATVIAVDATGVGFGFVGSLRTALPNRAIVAFVASSSADTKNPDGTRLYENKRAELWYEVGREFSRRGGWDLSRMEEQEQTLAELATPRYEVKKGVIKVESKDEIRKRIKRSPDHADALLLSFWTPKEGGEMTVAAPSGVTLPTGAGSVARPLVGAGSAGVLPTRIGMRGR